MENNKFLTGAKYVLFGILGAIPGAAYLKILEFLFSGLGYNFIVKFFMISAPILLLISIMIVVYSFRKGKKSTGSFFIGLSVGLTYIVVIVFMLWSVMP